MITSIEHKNRRYLTGIFANKSQAIAHHQKMKEEEKDPKDNFLLIDTNLPFYPIYLIEGLEKTFIYTDDQTHIIDLLKRTSQNRKTDPDHIYYNIYRITENDYCPYLGSDSMGMLEHYHINNKDLDYFEKTGFPDFFGHYDNLLRQLEQQAHNLTTQLKTNPNDKILENQHNEVNQVLNILKTFNRYHVDTNSIDKIIPLPYLKQKEGNYQLIKDHHSTDPTQWEKALLKKHPTLQIKERDYLIVMKEES